MIHHESFGPGASHPPPSRCVIHQHSGTLRSICHTIKYATYTSYNSPATRGPPPPRGPCVSADHGLQRLRVTAVRLAPRGAPEHAHHAVVLLEGRAPWTKFRMHLETRRAAETTTGAGRFFCLKHSPANLDPPLERRLNSHIRYVRPKASRPDGGRQ